MSVWNVLRGRGNPSFAPPPPQNLRGDWKAFREWIYGKPEEDKSDPTYLGSSQLSQVMRAGAFPDEAARLMDIFRRAHRTTGPVVLYRGLPEESLDADDRSFITCTSAVEIAWRYSRKMYENNVVAALLVPPGTPMISKRGASRDSEYLLLPGHLAVAGAPLCIRLPALSQHDVRDLFKLPPEKLRYRVDDIRELPRNEYVGVRPEAIMAVPVHYTPDTSLL